MADAHDKRRLFATTVASPATLQRCEMSDSASSRSSAQKSVQSHVMRTTCQSGRRCAPTAWGKRCPPSALTTESFTYRLIFTKLATTSLTSQLDLTRNLPRIIRAAQPSTARLQPEALMTYGPALPSGSRPSARSSTVALKDVEPETLVEQINAVTDPGLRVVGAARLAEVCAAVHAGQAR